MLYHNRQTLEYFTLFKYCLAHDDQDWLVNSFTHMIKFWPKMKAIRVFCPQERILNSLISAIIRDCEVEYHFQGSLVPMRDEFFTVLLFKNSPVIFWFIHSDSEVEHGLPMPTTEHTNLYDAFSDSSIDLPLEMNVLNVRDLSR